MSMASPHPQDPTYTNKIMAKKKTYNKFICPECGQPAFPIITGHHSCDWIVTQKDLDFGDFADIQPTFDEDEEFYIEARGFRCSECGCWFAFEKEYPYLDDIFDEMERRGFIKEVEVDDTKKDDLLNTKSSSFDKVKVAYHKYISDHYENQHAKQMPDDIDKEQYANENHLFNLSEFILDVIRKRYSYLWS